MLSITPFLRPEQLLALESTTWPGTRDEVLLPYIKNAGLNPGEDFYLFYSPEREDPGNEKCQTQTIPKIVGGHTSICLEAGEVLYGSFIDTIVPVTSTRSAEMVKLLGCYGDGGAMLTEHNDLAELMSSLRFHGKSRYKYDNVRIGMNSRLDTLQAAILLEKIAIYDEEIAVRQRVAERYTTALKDRFVTPHVPNGMRSIWAQYTLRASSEAERDAALGHLRSQRIPTAVYYPRPLHLQTAYTSFPADPAGLPESEAASRTVFSLPIHPYLEEQAQALIIEACLSVPAVKAIEPS